VTTRAKKDRTIKWMTDGLNLVQVNNYDEPMSRSFSHKYLWALVLYQ
jgi:hypothetical protein